MIQPALAEADITVLRALESFDSQNSADASNIRRVPFAASLTQVLATRLNPVPHGPLCQPGYPVQFFRRTNFLQPPVNHGVRDHNGRTKGPTFHFECCQSGRQGLLIAYFFRQRRSRRYPIIARNLQQKCSWLSMCQYALGHTSSEMKRQFNLSKRHRAAELIGSLM